MAKTRKTSTKKTYAKTFAMWIDLENMTDDTRLELDDEVATVTCGCISFTAYVKNPEDFDDSSKAVINISAYDDTKATEGGISISATCRFLKD